jgi:hypothetical protein
MPCPRLYPVEGGGNVSLLWQFAVPIVASFVGLAVWRYQMIGKRRYDVAEEVLGAAHAAVVSLHQIRRARAQADLSASANPDALRPDQAMVTHTPLQTASFCFQQLDAKANAITWHFGQKAAEPLIDLQAVYRRLWDAQSGLFYGHPADRRYATAEPPTKSINARNGNGRLSNSPTTIHSPAKSMPSGKGSRSTSGSTSDRRFGGCCSRFGDSSHHVRRGLMPQTK